MKNIIVDWIYKHLADEHWGGGESPPGSSQRLDFGALCDDGEPMYVARTDNNDGCEIWLGFRRGKWNVFYNQQEARKLAWFILWTWWAKGTWFGLKRKIWYWALHEQVTRMNLYATRHREQPQ